MRFACLIFVAGYVEALPSDTPATKRSILGRYIPYGRYPLAQRIEDKKRGIGRQKYPVIVWALTATMISVFIYELVVNAKAQGTPISFKPVVNPMLGPSGSALINLGARFPPCMKSVSTVPATLQLPCLNDTANPPDRLCSIETLCGFGGFHGREPNQWWRRATTNHSFITPIFLHAGIVHLLLNMLAQLTAAAQIEREMGSGGFFILYFAAGIFGNVLGGNFSLVGVPSLGASGAIFGTVAVAWVDLFAHWKIHYRPVRRLVFMIVELVIGIAIGYIPYVDNFAHIGGFVMGVLVGTTFYPVISTTRRHKLVMFGFRVAAIPLAVILYVVLVRNFYTSDPYAACSGCRYLSCIPTSSNNHCQGCVTSFCHTLAEFTMRDLFSAPVLQRQMALVRAGLQFRPSPFQFHEFATIPDIALSYTTFGLSGPLILVRTIPSNLHYSHSSSRHTLSPSSSCIRIGQLIPQHSYVFVKECAGTGN
ncbi:rhomboid-domain-containing protein, partial [Artomyces pyxidatus]